MTIKKEVIQDDALKSARAMLTNICHRVAGLRLVSAHGGNVSMRIGDQILITPSGFALGEVTPKDFILVDLKGNVKSGTHKPSSETPMHVAIYAKRPDVRAIVHSHSPAATAFACVEKEIKPVNPETEILLKKVPIVPFKPYGTQELADEVVKYIDDANGVLLAKHGVVAIGQNLKDAFYLADLIEEAAKINMYIHILGK